jgi:hypothetical protein
MNFTKSSGDVTQVVELLASKHISLRVQTPVLMEKNLILQKDSASEGVL